MTRRALLDEPRENAREDVTVHGSDRRNVA